MGYQKRYDSDETYKNNNSLALVSFFLILFLSLYPRRVYAVTIILLIFTIMLSRLRAFLDQWIISIQSYPVSHIIIIAMTIVWMIAIESDYNTMMMDTLIKLLLVGGLMLPLSVIRPKHRITQVAVVAVWLAYYLLLPYLIDNIVYTQWVWIVGSIIIAWIIPSVVTARDHQDSQELTWSQFTHRWTSLAQWVIGGLILWWGIAASLASIEFLFSVDLGSDIYQHIGVISVLCIGWWIWLINLQQQTLSPTDSSLVKEQQMSYPRWMRIFWQYIFLPLCVIYGLILISYGIKIIATGVWPEWQLVYMVAGYVGFWLLTWFFLLPLERDNSWLSNSYRALFISFVVTSGLMIGAIFLRLQQYGWTIDRVFVVALIAWIIIMWLGSVIWTSKKWMIGLWSLVLIILWSIFITPTLIYHIHISPIQLTQSNLPQTTDQKTELYRSMDYLSKNYGTWRLTQLRLTPEQLISLSGANQYDLATQAMSVLWITGYETVDYGGIENNYRSFYSSNQWSIDISWYRTMIQFDRYQLESSPSDDVSISGNIIEVSDTRIDLSTYVDDLSSFTKQPNSKPYTITQDNIKLIITQANGQKTSTGSTIDWFDGYALVK